MGRMQRALWTGLAATFSLTLLTGCPQLAPGSGQDIPELSQFDIPDDATFARIRGGDEIVWAQPDDNAFTYDFFLAQRGERRADHDIVARVPAEGFGFVEGEALPDPNSIDVADDLQRAVISFDDGSFLLDAEEFETLQIIDAFRVTPLTVFGEPVFDPVLNAAGDRLAFETFDQQVGVATLDATSAVVNPTILGAGVNPNFGFVDNTLGFADPTFTNFSRFDFNRGVVENFELNDDFTRFVSARPVTTFEAGLSPFGIDRVGTFTGATPFDTVVGF